MAVDLCSCSSGRPYKACCGPFHDGAALPPTCEALMRSRYCAFARKKVDYLLATSHPDLIAESGGSDAFRRDLRRTCDEHRYPGLTVVEHRQGDDEGEVLFVAKVFRKGSDLTFSERSTFVRLDGRWLYLSGVPGA